MDKIKFRGIKLRFLSISVIVTLIALVGLQVLLFLSDESIIDIPVAIRSKINSITLVIVTFFLTSLLLRLTIKRVFNFFEEPEEKLFYSKTYSWSLYSIGLFVILHHFGVSLGNITIFIGLIATGLAFAVRDVLLLFFGWIILLQKKPFRIGDYIRIGEDEGKVIHIGTFYVLLDKTPELPDDYTRVPNRLFLEKSIIKLGKENMHDKIVFNLTEMPLDRDKITQELKANIDKVLEYNGCTSVYMDIVNEKLVLVVKFLVSIYERQSIRSTIIDIVFERCRGFIAV